MNNRSRPEGVVIPTLIYDDVPAAVEWLCRVFGFSVRLVAGTTHAQLACGEGGGVMLGASRIEDAGEGSIRAFEPPGDRPVAQSTMVVVGDVDAHFARTTVQGATIELTLATYAFGERQYTARDLAGHRWAFSQAVEDVDPASWGARTR
jgi:uncharacterized glyoxalase superfamily protein PhnB